MKKAVLKDENNCFFKKIDAFVQQYEQNYGKKIKMKKSKK